MEQRTGRLGYRREWGEILANCINNAQKDDANKLMWDLVPWDAMEDVVGVLNHGAVKYDYRNWENGMKWSRLFSAAMRHMVSWFQFREDKDKESGISHLSHAICCLLFILSYELRKSGEDDRPRIYDPI